MVSVDENVSIISSVDEREGAKEQATSVQVRRKRVRKWSGGISYPLWTVDHERDIHHQALLNRLAAVQLSLPHRLRPLFPQLSPIARLPSEILASIFIHAIQSPASNSAVLSQLVISSVCRAWRTVALSTPEYWATLYVSSKMPVTVYREFLARSSPFPLSIEFYSWPRFKRYQYTCSNICIIEEMLDILQRETYRLKSVTAQQRTCYVVTFCRVVDWTSEHLM
ncbi:hypothetical protein EDD16DRAFT_116267 [Pisolithus croceorrhizus]|nr:hypothetical protein EV401DRAFT_510720 [Pisolithus croceorrhizus]KAI6107183.1 hypothetical protein EDD16DRAFT_116267 [Pisolithus croceorrhizus]KAI6143146.1 hypothetical protein EDD17DRAFT_210581 [Pisolithus thermaeus]